MTDQSPLRRKIGSAARPRTPAVTPERLWTRAVTYGLARRFDMPAEVRRAASRPIMPEACADLVETGMMLVLLDCSAGYGLALLDPAVKVALIEQQTLGRVGRRSVSARPPTLTDASMMAEPLDQIFRMHEGMAGELPPPRPVSGFRYATRIVEPREFVLHLEDRVHDHWTIEMALGEERAREGRMQLVLPRERPERPDGEGATGRTETWSRQIEARVLGSELAVTAELGRLTLSAAAIRALKVGDAVPLPRSAVGAVRLVGPNGSNVLIGRLGQSAGRKAIRVGRSEERDAELFIAAGPTGEE